MDLSHEVLIFDVFDEETKPKDNTKLKGKKRFAEEGTVGLSWRVRDVAGSVALGRLLNRVVLSSVLE